MTPDQVAALFHPHRDDDPDSGQSKAEGSSRTAKLTEVFETVKHLWASGSTDLDLIGQRLGDGSRHPSWRVPMGESGLVDFFLGLLCDEHLRPALKTQCLRLIGNSCADTDENRARVVAGDHLGRLVQLLADDSSLGLVIPVLYNICVDYEPAQSEACHAGLSAQLVGLISGNRFVLCRGMLSVIGKILALLVSQDAEIKQTDPKTPFMLLGIATNAENRLDLEEFCGLVSVALAYLANAQLQSHLLSSGGFPMLQHAFSSSYTHAGLADADPDDLAELQRIRQALVQILADVSADPTFGMLYPVGSPVAQELLSWLGTPATCAQLQIGACLCLGNLARSDQASIALAPDAYPLLFRLLASTEETSAPGSAPGILQAQPPVQLIHAILSFLKNLAIPTANKTLIGALLEPPRALLPRMWSSPSAASNAQLQFAAISLTRLLLTGSPANVRRFCAPLSPDPSSPAYDRSNLHVLVSLFDRLDAEPSKMEAARAVLAVCRTLHSTPVLSNLRQRAADTDRSKWVPPAAAPSSIAPHASTAAADLDSGDGADGDSSDEAAAGSSSGSAQTKKASRLARFYTAQQDMRKPLMFLITQRRFPALRSEAWFVFALMSRTREGAHLVVRVLQPMEALQALVEAVTGRDVLSGGELRAEEGAGVDELDGLQAGGGGSSSGSVSGSSSGLLQMPGAPGLADPGTPFTDSESLLEELALSPRQVDSGPAKEDGASMRTVDRENALVMISELLKHYGQHFSPYRKTVFEELLRTGGRSVLLDKALGGDSEQQEVAGADTPQSFPLPDIHGTLS